MSTCMQARALTEHAATLGGSRAAQVLFAAAAADDDDLWLVSHPLLVVE